MCGFRLSPGELLRANSSSGYTRLLVGNPEEGQDQLRLGGLGGNRFTIVLRSLPPSLPPYLVGEACEKLAEGGFINFFGAQRFGSYGGGTSTSSIGACLLQRDWAGAAEKVLRPREGEGEGAREARVWWVEKGDPKGALARMPRGMGIEVSVLRAYERNGKDAHLNAIQVGGGGEGGREGGVGV